ncbi:hypothetical protein AAZX31_13G025100 [Glycine max]|uniref:Uncharacterized protein n=2 Tax=Glycine subgen. Soja TaxID=1462606 RepID=I1LXA5_SOYBN|nr:probable transcription factor At5g61620 [Glycine max]XP_028196912.1 probable transcription factor At5g61620 [Glycine soja]KAG5129209.1 hypothetical protein JHK84_035606 [Glycine max]KAH1099699.1 hypothetical protein GYH30_035052 [Glycine max]KHN03893.1 Transcription factor MYB1R1 [Glycine soja]KRH18108.1 hypothetical protein GLYMA_13G038200v4 [Glycine max]RZB70774.1 Transcription factor DIVARICATA [Glycine soja]|eukprot:XP_006593764.1 probable transcription factor At5g61620 isoform X1 [Glycine max]
MPQLQRRNTRTRWTEEEHRLFLIGMERFGKSNWTNIAQHVVLTKTPSQVASHAQKFFLHHSSVKQSKRQRKIPSIHDITLVSQPVSQHNPVNDQLAEKLHVVPSQQLTDFEGCLAIHLNDQLSRPPSTMAQDLQIQQLPHFVDHDSWVSTPNQQVPKLPHNLLDQDKWIPPLGLQIHQFSDLIDDHIDLAPLPDLLELPLPYLPLPHHLDQEKWIPPQDLQTHQLPHFMDHDNWVSTPNQQFPELPHHLLDQENWTPPLDLEIHQFSDFIDDPLDLDPLHDLLELPLPDLLLKLSHHLDQEKWIPPPNSPIS